jgi:hypothetical protein
VLLLALTTPLVLLGMLLGMHAVERRLDGDDRVPDAATAPVVLELPRQREGAESESRGVGRSLTA